MGDSTKFLDCCRCVKLLTTFRLFQMVIILPPRAVSVLHALTVPPHVAATEITKSEQRSHCETILLKVAKLLMFPVN